MVTKVLKEHPVPKVPSERSVPEVLCGRRVLHSGYLRQRLAGVARLRRALGPRQVDEVDDAPLGDLLHGGRALKGYSRDTLGHSRGTLGHSMGYSRGT